MRTERSRTYRLADGSFEQEISALALNYRDATGAWRPIDNSLVAESDGTVTNLDNSFNVRIPQRASGEVEISAGGDSLAFELLHGATDAVVRSDGEEARFEDARKDVELTYEAAGRSLKETLTLSSAQVPAIYEFAVEAPGLRPVRDESGAVLFRDGAGAARFAFAAPWMRDAAGDISRDLHYEIRQTPGRDIVALVLDRGWLTAPDRAFPVTVDPTVTQAPEGMCELVSGSDADEDFCAEAMPIGVGRWEGKIHRAAIALELPPDVSEISRIITSAELRFELDEQYWSGPSQLDLHSLRAPMNPGATWNSAGPGRPWRTAGGDLSAEREGRVAVTAADIDGPVAIGVPRLVQALTDGSEPNDGVVIKAVDESAEHIDVLEDFMLKVRYHHRTGLDEAAYHYDRWDLSDGTRVHVNTANQNLVVSHDDFGLNAFDDALSIDRVYNSQNDVTGTNVFGVDWRGDFGTVSLTHNAVDDSYALHGPTGVDGLFVKRPDGSYLRLRNGSMTLSVDPVTRAIRVVDLLTEEEWLFDAAAPHRLARRSFPSEAGAQATFDANGRVATLRDSLGNSATFAYDASGKATTVTDQDGGVRSYEYDAGGRLVRYTSAARETTTYGIDASGRLRSITAPDGSGITFTYYGTSRYLATVTPFDTSGTPGATTTYEGSSAGVEIHTRGQLDVMRYYGPGLFNTRTLVGASPPSLTLSGALYDARDTLLPEGQTVLRFSASDSAGIAEAVVSVDGGEESLDRIDCSATCGTTNDGEWTFDTAEFGGGDLAVTVSVTDANGNRHEQSFRVSAPQARFIDDPSIPADLETDPEFDVPATLEPCEQLFGVGSEHCTTANNVEPSDGATGSISIAANQPVYGIAQDSENPAWLDVTELGALRVNQYRRIRPFNMAQRLSNGRFRFPNRVEQFRKLIRKVENGESGQREPGTLMVSLGYGCTEDIRDENSTHCESTNGLPGERPYKAGMRAILRAFPEVFIFSAWNEPNIANQALEYNPKRAARYTRWAMEVCRWWKDAGHPACVVLAAELAQDKRGPNAYSMQYLRRYRDALRAEIAAAGLRWPTRWALHPYVDVKDDVYARRHPGYLTGVDYFDRAIPGKQAIWFTEVGSRIDAHPDLRFPRNDLQEQAAEVHYLYRSLAGKRSAVKRLYYYSFCSRPIGSFIDRQDFDDSGLMGGGLRYPYGGCNGARPAYDAVKSYTNP